MLKRSLYAIGVACCVLLQIEAAAQCVVEASVFPSVVACGDQAFLSANGRGQGLQVFGENFDSGVPVGWAFTQQARFDNPCSPSGVDSTTHIWMGNTSASPRSLETLPYNFASASAGGTVCFDMLFATQGAGAPCEGPDLPEEGVYLQYSIDGVNWITIHYFDPNGGNDPQLVNWNNWCFQLPPQALTANTQIRWHQIADSGPDYDHWGIDNVQIFYNDPTYSMTWVHDGYNHGQGNSGGTNPNAVRPQQTTTYTITMSNGPYTCTDTITLTVVQPTVVVDAGPDLRVCNGECATLSATSKVVKLPAKTPTYVNNESVDIVPFSTDTPHLDINITDLNMSDILPGSITGVCITGLTYFSVFPPSTIGNLDIYLICPDGSRVLLVPSGVTSSPLPISGYTNTCFTPVATDSLANGTLPYSGSFIPAEPLDNLVGCTANGVWSIEVVSDAGSLGAGVFTGWSISFDDPEISYTAELTWNPTTGLSDSNAVQPIVCPTQDISYTLSGSDTAGCVTDYDTVNVIVDNTDLHITATLTNPDCGVPDGAIDLEVTGGSGTYTYAWSNGAITQDITAVGAGIYTVVVTDPAHCAEDTVFNLSTANGPVINSITPTAETCFGLNNGSIAVSASGGTGALSYLWNNGRTTATITGLAPGNYTVTVSDALDCETVAFATVGAGGNVIAFFVTTDESCANACDGAATVTASGGTGALTYQWSDGSVTTPNRTGLCNQSYVFTVTDANGCTESGAFFINSGGALSVGLGDDIVVCEGIDITLDAGVGFAQYNWSTTETTQAIDVTTSGDYSVTVSNGTCTASDTVAVTITPGPVVTVLPANPVIFVGDTVALNASVQGNPSGTFMWEPQTTQLSCTDCPDPVFTSVIIDSVGFVVTFFDQQECAGTDTVVIRILPEEVTPIVPSAFNPSSLLPTNRTIFVIPNNDIVTVKEFRVYNRWGQEVHNATKGWDGKFNGKEQPIGTYSYYAVVEIAGTQKKMSGAFSLLR